MSFELAEKRLSANPLNFSTSTSSVAKGESLRDTMRNIEAMKIDMVVVRHSAAGAPSFLTRCTDASIINAGDGLHEHPTQALLDMLPYARSAKNSMASRSPLSATCCTAAWHAATPGA